MLKSEIHIGEVLGNSKCDKKFTRLKNMQAVYDQLKYERQWKMAYLPITLKNVRELQLKWFTYQ